MHKIFSLASFTGRLGQQRGCGRLCIRRETAVREGSFFLRLDCYSWCSPAPYQLHTDFHNEWPGTDIRWLPHAAFLQHFWWARYSWICGLVPKEGCLQPDDVEGAAVHSSGSMKLLSCCMICKISIMLELEGNLEIIYSSSLIVQLQNLEWPRSLCEDTQQQELDSPKSCTLLHSF